MAVHVSHPTPTCANLHPILPLQTNQPQSVCPASTVFVLRTASPWPGLVHLPAREMPVSAAFVSHFATVLRPPRNDQKRISPRRRCATMRSRGGGLNSRKFRVLVEDATLLWRRAGPAERVGMAAVALGAATVASTVVSVVAHAGAMLTFFLLPLIFLPIAIALAASLGTILLAFLALGGVGSFVVLTPVFALGVFARLAAEVLIAAAFVSVAFATIGGIISRAMPRASDAVRDFRKGVENLGEKGGFDGGFDDFGDDIFRAFDKQLHRRDGSARREISRLGSWTVDDVVDELVASGLGQYASQFESERIDGSVLLSLTESDIRAEFGQSMPLGDRKRVWRWVSSLQRQFASG